MIERIERYHFDGQEFGDLDKVGKYIENEIGKIIDSTLRFRLHPQNALSVYNAIVNNRKRLVTLLSASYTEEETEEKKSIFDRP